MAESQKQNHANQGQDGTVELEGTQKNPTNSPAFDDRQRAEQLRENAQDRPERARQLAESIASNLGQKNKRS
jgi:hypothetical protein